MYYPWNWWFLLSWSIPMALFVWMLFGVANTRRYPRYWSYDRELREDWEDRLGSRREPKAARNRGLGPRNYRRSDARIIEDVSDRLMMDSEIDASDMEVQVENGKVILAGRVGSRLEKRLAELAADAVPGVNDVENRLQIGRSAESHGQAHQHAFSR